MRILGSWINQRKCLRGHYVLWDIFVITLVIFLFTPALSKEIEEFKFSERLGPENFDYKIIDAFVKSGQKGILTAFKGHPEMRGTELQLSYFLKVGQPFKADFMIGNYTDKPVDYFIICLLDYAQQKFIFNGNQDTTHSISIKPKERIIYPLIISDIKKGTHDFLLLAFRRLKDRDTSEKVEYLLLYHRANIFAESYSLPEILYSKFSQQSSELRASQIVVNSSKEYNDFKELSFDTRLSTEKLKYYLHVNNPYNEIVSFASILFLDYNQSSFKPTADKDVLYYYLNPKNQSIIAIKTAFANQIKSLWAIGVENPYVRLETETGTMNQIPTRVRISNIISFQK